MATTVLHNFANIVNFMAATSACGGGQDTHHDTRRTPRLDGQRMRHAPSELSPANLAALCRCGVCAVRRLIARWARLQTMQTLKFLDPRAFDNGMLSPPAFGHKDSGLTSEGELACPATRL